MTSLPTPSRPGPGGWSREDVSELVAGRSVMCTDHGSHSRLMPDWLVRSARDVMKPDPTDWSRGIHPLDRTAAAGAFVDAVGRPFEVMHARFRSRASGELHQLDILVLNLAGEHGIEILTAIEDLGPIPDLDRWDHLEARFVFETTPVAIEYYDRLGVKVWAEGQVREIYGRGADTMIGQPGRNFMHPRHHGAITALWLSLMDEPDLIRSMRLEIVQPDDTTLWAEVTLINRLEDERIGAVICLTNDITEQLAAEELARDHELAMRRSHEEFESLANGVPVAVFRADADGRVTFANRHWCLLAGIDVVDHDGPVDLTVVVAADDRDELARSLATLASSATSATMSVEVRSGDGARVFELVCQVVGEQRLGDPRPIIGTMRDVTSAHELRHQARHDALTKLLNRNSIDVRLAEALADDPGHVLVAFIDLDGFKAVNDTFGHDVGDGVLRVIAARLCAAVRPSDHVGRYGGDEFVIVCPNAFAGAEVAVTSRIERAMAGPITVCRATWQPAASMGLVRAEAGEEAAAVLRRADGAMYSIKRSRPPPGVTDRVDGPRAAPGAGR